MKLVTGHDTLSAAAGAILRSIGFGNFAMEAFKAESARDEFTLRLHRHWTVEGRRLADADAAIAWLHQVGKGLKQEILASEAFVNLIAAKDAEIAKAKEQVADLVAQVQYLAQFKIHYDMEFELQHGRERYASDPEKPA